MRAANAQAVKPKYLVVATATTSSERGLSSITVISPKNRPFPRVVSSFPFFSTSTFPSRISRSASPGSPSRRMVFPFSKVTSRPAPAILSLSFLSRPEKSGMVPIVSASNRVEFLSSGNSQMCWPCRFKPDSLRGPSVDGLLRQTHPGEEFSEPRLGVEVRPDWSNFQGGDSSRFLFVGPFQPIYRFILLAQPAVDQSESHWGDVSLFRILLKVGEELPSFAF